MCIHTVIDPCLMPWTLLTKNNWHSVTMDPSVVSEQDVSECQYRLVVIIGFILGTGFGGGCRGQGGELQHVGLVAQLESMRPAQYEGAPPTSLKQNFGLLLSRCFTHTLLVAWGLETHACCAYQQRADKENRTWHRRVLSVPILPLRAWTVSFACDIPWV